MKCDNCQAECKVYEIGYDEKNNPIVSATRKQIPLTLSWGITIHKSQGQSIERLKVDLGGCFAAGQVYVALSHATNPNYLQIIDFPYSRLFCRTKQTQRRKLNMTKDYEEIINDLETQTDELKNGTTTIKRSHPKIKSDIEKIRQLLNAINAKCEKLQTTVGELKADMAEIQTNYEDLQTQIVEVGKLALAQQSIFPS
ncbi:17059_t:CDS:2 [Racocetra fulgida]|uniref:17059_t:CDS:1 n=1 Tax=Racocetra fulgida TaxID=60492 RepID=A0A9N9N7U2_9GLOM|nr:17059_t:CDS:2 [Racocetra fulgida]